MDTLDRIRLRRLLVAIGGGFDVTSRRFNRAFCDCLRADIETRPEDVVPYEATISRIRATLDEDWTRIELGAA